MKRVIVMFILGTILYVVCALISHTFSSGWFAGIIFGTIIIPYTHLKYDKNENSATNKT